MSLVFLAVAVHPVLADITTSFPIPGQNITAEGAFSENTHTTSGTDTEITTTCYGQVNTTDGTTCRAADGSASLDAKMVANLSTPERATITSVFVAAVITESGATADNCDLGLWNWSSNSVVDVVSGTACSSAALVTLTYNITGAAINDFVRAADPIVSVIPHTSGGSNADLDVDSINITVTFTPPTPILRANGTITGPLTISTGSTTIFTGSCESFNGTANNVNIILQNSTDNITFSNIKTSSDEIIFANATNYTLGSLSGNSSNVQFLVNATKPGTYTLRAQCNASNTQPLAANTSGVNLTVNQAFGYLNVSLNNPLGGSSTKINQNATFIVNVSVRCIGAHSAICDEVNASVRRNTTSGGQPIVNVPSGSGTPFHHIIGGENQTCGRLNWSSPVCSLQWTVNASGTVGTTSLLDVNFTSNQSSIASNDTENFNINITGVETTPPTVAIQSPANSTFNSSSVSLNYTASDNVAIDKCTRELDGTNSSLPNCDNQTMTVLGSGQHTVKIYANDTAGNTGNSSAVTFTVDTQFPQFANLTEEPADPAEYSANRFYRFNSTWTDNEAVDNVFVEFDGVNYTGGNITKTGDVYSFNRTGLIPGVHNYKWFANDTVGNLNQTSGQTYTVQDTAAPSLALQQPQNKTYNSNASLPLNFTASDALLDKCFFNIDNSANITLASCNNSTFNASEGGHTLNLFSNDTSGNLNKSSVNFTVDITKPAVTIQNPANATLNQTPTLNFTVTDASTIAQCWYVLNGGVNTTLTNCSNLSSIGSEGFNSLIVYANDTAGNIGNTTVGFTLDITNPQITVQNPANNSVFGVTNISLNYTASDNFKLDACTLINSTGQVQILSGCQNTTLTATANSVNNITVIINDTSGRTNSSQVFFTIDTIAPSATIQNPANATLASSSVNLNYTVTDGFGTTDRCTRELDGANTSLAGCSNQTIGGLADGQHSVKIYLNDTAGNIGGSSLVTFAIDTAPPAIAVQSPTNATFASSSVNLNFTISDSSGISACTRELDGTNTTIVGCNNQTIEGLSHGHHRIKIYVNDSGGNIGNSSPVTFTVDITPFTIVFVSPTPNNQTITVNFTLINVTTGETPNAILLEWNGTNETMSGSGTNWNKSKTNLANGNYTFKVYANDSFGNLNVSETRYAFANVPINGTLKVSPDSINKTLAKGNSASQTVSYFTEGGNQNLTIDLAASAGAPGDWITFNSTHFTIPFDKAIGISTVIAVPSNQSEGTFNGTITATAADGQQKNVSVKVVVNDTAVFDVTVEVLPQFKTVNRGGDVQAEINMTKMAGPGGPTDVNLTYSIIDSNSAVQHQRTASIAVNVSNVATYTLTVPTSAPAGTYTFRADITFDTAAASGSDTFTVQAPETPSTASGGGGSVIIHRLAISNLSNITGKAGETKTLSAAVSNTGNKEENVTVDLLTSWNYDISPNGFSLKQRESKEVLMTLFVPAGAAAGEHPVVLRAKSKDATTETTIFITVSESAGFAVQDTIRQLRADALSLDNDIFFLSKYFDMADAQELLNKVKLQLDVAELLLSQGKTTKATEEADLGHFYYELARKKMKDVVSENTGPLKESISIKIEALRTENKRLADEYSQRLNYAGALLASGETVKAFTLMKDIENSLEEARLDFALVAEMLGIIVLFYIVFRYRTALFSALGRLRSSNLPEIRPPGIPKIWTKAPPMAVQKATSLTALPGSVEKTIYPGSSSSQELTIVSSRALKVKLLKSAGGASDWIRFSETGFDLRGEKEITVDINVPTAAEEGEYKAAIHVDFVEGCTVIPVTVHVSYETMVDLDVHVLGETKNVFEGDEVKATITISKRGENVEGKLGYAIIDKLDTAIHANSVDVYISDEPKTIDVRLPLPKNLEEGIYTLKAEFFHGNDRIWALDSFYVRKRKIASLIRRIFEKSYTPKPAKGTEDFFTLRFCKCGGLLVPLKGRMICRLCGTSY